MRLKVGKKTNGFIPVYLVKEDGSLVNTEPVCLGNEEYHKWFLDWLEGQFVGQD